MYKCSKKLVTWKGHWCFHHSDFSTHLIFTFDVCLDSLGTSIFRNSSSAASNTRSRLTYRLPSFSYDYAEYKKVSEHKNVTEYKKSLNIKMSLNFKKSLNINMSLNIEMSLNINMSLNIKKSLNVKKYLNTKMSLNIRMSLNIKKSLNINMSSICLSQISLTNRNERYCKQILIRPFNAYIQDCYVTI